MNFLDNFAERWRVNHIIFFIYIWAKILRLWRTLDLDLFLAANHFSKSVIINQFFMANVEKSFGIMLAYNVPVYWYFQYALHVFTCSKFVLFGIKLCIALWSFIEKLLFFNVQVPLWRLNNPALFSVKVLLHQTTWILPGQHLQNFQVRLIINTIFYEIKIFDKYIKSKPILSLSFNRTICDCFPYWKNRKKVYNGIWILCFQCVCFVGKYLHIKVRISIL